MKFGFNKKSGKKAIAEAVTSLQDLVEIMHIGKDFKNWGAKKHNSLAGGNLTAESTKTDLTSKKTTHAFFREDLAGAIRRASEKHVKPSSWFGDYDTIAIELVASKPGSTTHEHCLAELVIRLDEKYDEQKLKDGTLKARIVDYTLDGEPQDISKPIDLSIMLDYHREMESGFVPLPRPVQPQGYVPMHRREGGQKPGQSPKA